MTVLPVTKVRPAVLDRRGLKGSPVRLERKVIRARKVLAEPRVRPDLRVSKAR